MNLVLILSLLLVAILVYGIFELTRSSQLKE